MNKLTKVLLGALILFLLGTVISYFTPTKLERTYEGIAYQLGTESVDTTDITIVIDGVVKRNLKGKKPFMV